MKTIDLFAGIGGSTIGAIMAGCDVLWAANHWPEAVKFHSLNHPEVAHVCQDLHQADWSRVPAHDLLLASPCCQGHAKARGKDRPHHDISRSTAWAVVSCAEFHRPPFFVVENVPEFLTWKLFPAWEMAMNALGYSLAPHTIDAADHGVSQHRVRLYIVGTRSKATIRLPLSRRPHVPIKSVIDFEAGEWSPIYRKGRARATLERVENGRKAFGDRFVMPYYKSGSGKTGRSLDRPLGTITTRDRWAIVDGDRMRMVSKEEYREAQGLPKSYILPSNKKSAVFMIGNAVSPPPMRDLILALKSAA